MAGEKFLVDGVSGAVFQINQLIWDYFVLLETEKENTAWEKLALAYSPEEAWAAKEELTYLTEQGWLFADDAETEKRAAALSPGTLKSLCLHIAHDCNLRCRYCFASTGDYKGKRAVMSQEVALKAIDFLLAQSPEVKNYILDFFGGEPLLNFAVVREAVLYAERKAGELGKSFKFSLTTNATLLNEEKTAFLNEHNIEVILSLDGDSSTHDAMRPFPDGSGSQAVVLKKAREFIASRGENNYYIRGTFTGLNPYFMQNITYLIAEGFKNISLEPVVALPAEEYALSEADLPVIFQEYEKLAEFYLSQYKENKAFHFFHYDLKLRNGPCLARRIMGCGAGTEYLSIGPEGEIYPCHQFMGREKYAMGNILQGDFSRNIGEVLRKNHIYRKKCRDCWARFYCSGGCQANADLINQDIAVPYELGCEIEKKRLECLFYLQDKLQRSNEA